MGSDDAEFFCTQCGEIIKGEQDSSTCQKCGGALQPRWKTQAIKDPYLKKQFDGKYLTTRLIGRGGTSQVYEAKHLTLNKAVCIKVLSADSSLMEHLIQRFQREADVISSLSHPNIVQVIDFGQSPETSSPYLVMEFVPGRHLGQLVNEEHPLEEKRIVHIVSQLLSALAEAHAAGIVHRDLKPANIIVTSLRTDEDFVKVLDFGIAKILDLEGEKALTKTGMLFGTPDYMAPEQGRGDAIDHRCDIYAVGCILYRMVTGEQVFEAETPMGVITKHLTEKVVPPSRREGARVSAGMEAVVLKALQKNPADRYQDVQAMQEALRALVTTDRPKPARQAFWRRIPRRVVYALIGATGLIVILAVSLLLTSGEDEKKASGEAEREDEIRDLIAAGQEVDVDRVLDEAPDGDEASVLAKQAHTLLAGPDPEIDRGTELIQGAIEGQPGLLDDEKVRQTLVRTLDRKDATGAIDFIVGTAGRAVIDELSVAAANESYWLRRNSVKALKKLDALDRADQVLFFIADLKYAETCAVRKHAVKMLTKLKDKRALDALRKASQRGTLENLCMGDAIQEAIRTIEN